MSDMLSFLARYQDYLMGKLSYAELHGPTCDSTANVASPIPDSTNDTVAPSEAREPENTERPSGTK